MRKTTAKNWTGKKLYRLTFIESTSERRNDYVVWKAECECGNFTYLPPNFASRGITKSCGCLRKESAIKSGQQKRKHAPEITSARSVWSKSYPDIDFNTFYTLSQLPCYYCKRLPHRSFNVALSKKEKESLRYSELQVQKGFFIYNGLDRLDSSKGHILENIVPCCKNCNQAKNNESLEFFILHIKKMYEGTKELREYYECKDQSLIP